MSVRTLVDDIRAFLGEQDQSLSPRLRALHAEYSKYAATLVAQINECRDTADRVSLSEAIRVANEMDPPLADRVMMLNFFEKDAFLELCRQYELPEPPAIDSAFVDRLSSSTGENVRNIGKLLQEWRRIARTGTTAQRLELLRKIVAEDPSANVSWKKSLIETEKKRYAEIAQELENNAELATNQEALEQINMELHSPELVTKPSEELLARLQELLGPLQKQQAAAQVDAQLDEMQACYAARNDAALEEAYQEWQNLVANPLVTLTIEQKQFADDVGKYLENLRLDQEKKRQYDQLMAELQEAISSNAPYQNTLTLYNKLALLDLPLPKSLKDDMERLGEEHLANERRLNFRRVVYGTVIALACLTIIFAVIFIIQQRNAVNEGVRNIKAFLETGDYQGAIDYCNALQEKAPKIAADERILSLMSEAQSSRDRRNQEILLSRQEFQMLSGAVEEAMTGDFLGNDDIHKNLERLEALRDELDEEGRQQLTSLVTRMQARHRQLVQEHEHSFRTECLEIARDMDTLTASVNSQADIAEIEAKIRALSSRMGALTSDSSIDGGVRKNAEKIWEEKLDALNFSLGEEKTQRNLIGRLETPASYEAYIATLDEIRTGHASLAARFSRAIADKASWNAILEDMDAVNGYLSSRKPVQAVSSHVGQNFMTFFNKDSQKSFAPFAAKLSKLCKYYELIGIGEDNRKYFFYTKEPPLIEKDKRNRSRVKDIALDADACQNVYDRYFVLKVEKDAFGNVVFKDAHASQHVDIVLPTSFKELKDWQKPSLCDACAFATQYDELKKNGLNEGEIVAKLLGRLGAIKNPLIKYNIAMELLAVLRDVSALNEEEIDGMMTELKGCGVKAASWKVPDAVAASVNEVKYFEDTLKSINLEKLVAVRTMRWNFLGALFQRNLKPAGIVTLKKDNAVAFASFLKTKPRELYVFKDKDLRIVKSDLSRGVITAEQDTELLYEGQLLWTFMDGKTSEEFLGEWQKKAEAEKTKVLIEPALCPHELAYFLK